MSGFNCDEDRNFGENRRSTFSTIVTTFSSFTLCYSSLLKAKLRRVCAACIYSVTSCQSQCLSGFNCDEDRNFGENRRSTFLRMGQRSLRSPCATHHLLCHFVPIVVIRSKKTTTYPKCLGVVVVFMQNKNHIDGSSMWSFFLLEYNQHRYTFQNKSSKVVSMKESYIQLSTPVLP